jgi:4-amino-4-deoxy-L-arabinose transferase-like glycosyltransferase
VAGALLVVSVAASAWLLLLTDKGLGIGSDSAVYLAGAENLLAGKGFVWRGGDQEPQPITHYPPLYSMVLSAGLRLNASPESVARGLNAFLMGANTWLVGALVGLLSSSGIAAVFGALVFAVSKETLGLHSWAMSDPLYLFFVLLSLTGAVQTVSVRSGRGTRLVMWIAASLAFLTRYVGVSTMAVPVVATLAIGKTKRERAVKAAGALTLAMLPGLSWLARNQWLAGSLANRNAGIYPQGVAWWQELGQVIESWFLPGRIVERFEAFHLPALVVVGAGAFGAMALAWRYRSDLAQKAGGRLWPWLLVAGLGISHIAAIVISSWTIHPGPDIVTRTLAPAFAGLVVLLAAAAGVAEKTKTRAWEGSVILMAVAFLGFKLYAARDLIHQLARDGQGYTSVGWVRSPVVRMMEDLSPRWTYSNDIGAVYYFTGTYAYGLPLRYDSLTHGERPDYFKDYCQMRSRLYEGSGLLVLFDYASYSPQAPAREDLVEGLRALLVDSTGGIYEADGPPPPACAAVGVLSAGPAAGTEGGRKG